MSSNHCEDLGCFSATLPLNAQTYLLLKMDGSPVVSTFESVPLDNYSKHYLPLRLQALKQEGKLELVMQLANLWQRIHQNSIRLSISDA